MRNNPHFILWFVKLLLYLHIVKTNKINKIMKATNIKWDCKDAVLEYNIDDCDLPNEVEIPDGIGVFEVADYLSDEYGFLVLSFDYE